MNTNKDWAKEPSLWRRLRKNSQENRRQTGRTEARDGRCFGRKERPNYMLMEDLLTKREIRIFTARGEIRDLKIFFRQGWLGQGTRDSKRWGLESRGKDYPWPNNTLESVSDVMHLKITFPFPLWTYYLVYGLSRPLMVFLVHSQPAGYFNDCKHLNPGRSMKGDKYETKLRAPLFLKYLWECLQRVNLNLSVKVRFEGFKFLQWLTYMLEYMLDV